MSRQPKQSGQVLVLVAVALLALIGSAALVLLAGSAASQRNQLQSLADTSALDSALKIGIGCNAAMASTVITEADNFLATQRTRTGSLAIAAGTCATPYHGTDTFAGGLSADYYYPYRAHQQQVEVLLTLTLPISFGGAVGTASTTLTRYAVAQALPASVPAIKATTLSCTGGQVNAVGDVVVSNAITLSGGCALYAHQNPTSGAYSALGNVRVYTGRPVMDGRWRQLLRGSQLGLDQCHLRRRLRAVWSRRDDVRWRDAVPLGRQQRGERQPVRSGCRAHSQCLHFLDAAARSQRRPGRHRYAPGHRRLGLHVRRRVSGDHRRAAPRGAPATRRLRPRTSTASGTSSPAATATSTFAVSGRRHLGPTDRRRACACATLHHSHPARRKRGRHSAGGRP